MDAIDSPIYAEKPYQGSHWAYFTPTCILLAAYVNKPPHGVCCGIMAFIMSNPRSHVKGGPPVPVLRGYFHLGASFATLITLPFVIWALPCPLVRSAVCLALLQKAFLYYVSGVLHTTEFVSKGLLDRAFTIDHANIFLTLATDATSIYMTKVGVSYSLWPIFTVWLASSAIAIRIKIYGFHTNKFLQFALIVLMVVLLFNAGLRVGPTLRQLSTGVLICLISLAGAICWTLEAPNPLPGILGYHEILHIASLVAHALHVALILDLCYC